MLNFSYFRLAVLAVSLSTAQNVFAASESDQLKVYRSYYQIEVESKTAEQFEVWYETEGDGWDTFHLAIQDGERLASLPQERRLSSHTAFAGWPQPPAHPNPPPHKLKGLVQNIVHLVPVTFPDKIIKSVKVNYMGRSARVNLYQYIPADKFDPTAKYRPGRSSEQHFLVNTANGSVETFGGASAGGSLNEMKSGKFETSWLDITLPRRIEGNPVLDLSFYDQPGEVPWCLQKSLKHERARLIAAMIKRVRQIETGSGPDSDQILAKVMAEQEQTFLPQKVRQALEFEIDIFGRLKQGGQIEGRVKLLLPVTTQAMTVAQFDPATGVNIEATINLGAQTADVRVSRGGANLKASITLSPAKIIHDGTKAMATGPVYPKEVPELELPGEGDVTSFDVYLGRIEPRNFLTPLDQSACE